MTTPRPFSMTEPGPVTHLRRLTFGFGGTLKDAQQREGVGVSENLLQAVHALAVRGENTHAELRGRDPDDSEPLCRALAIASVELLEATVGAETRASPPIWTIGAVMLGSGADTRGGGSLEEAIIAELLRSAGAVALSLTGGGAALGFGVFEAAGLNPSPGGKPKAGRPGQGGGLEDMAKCRSWSRDGRARLLSWDRR